MKKNPDPKIVIKIEMILLVVFSLIAVTAAWFVIQESVQANNISLTAASDAYIRVALTPGGEDVLKLQENDAKNGTSTSYVDIQLNDYYNMTGNKIMAPGVSGQMDLYITSLSPTVNECTISFETLPTFIEGVQEGCKRETELYNLLSGHIQYYTSYNGNEADYSKRYSGRITEDTPLVVSGLRDGAEGAVGPEKKVTIYWVWFYEYTDIPAEGITYAGSGNTKIPLHPELYFDMDKYDSSQTDGYSLENLITFYDYGDTKIGLGVEDIAFRLKVGSISGD